MKSNLATESGKAKSIAKKATGKDYTSKGADLSNATINSSIRQEDVLELSLDSSPASNDHIRKPKENYNNLEAIKTFFSWYGSDTHSEFSTFFFNLLVNFINNKPDGGYSDDYKDATMMKIRMLNDLVKCLTMQDKIPD